MSDEKSNYVEEFLRKTHAAVESGIKKLTPDELNRKIMNTVNRWMENQTPAYGSFRAKPKNDIEFFAHNHAKAGVPRDVGWAYTKDKLKGFYDYEEDMKEEYDAEYGRTSFDQEFRDKFEKH